MSCASSNELSLRKGAWVAELLSRGVVLEAIRQATGQERRRGIGHRFFKGYTDALIDAAVWRPGRGTPAPWDGWNMPAHS